jgi:hypothetical protein
MTADRHPGPYDAPLTGRHAVNEDSARLRQIDYEAANKRHAETMAAADTALKAAPAGDWDAIRARDRAYAASGDQLAKAYFIADHAHIRRMQAGVVETVPAPLPTAAINHNGITVQRSVDAAGRVTDAPKFADPERGTFTGNAEDFAAAKRAAVMTPAQMKADASTPTPAQPGDARLAEILAEGKTVLIHTRPGWQNTRH